MILFFKILVAVLIYLLIKTYYPQTKTQKSTPSNQEPSPKDLKPIDILILALFVLFFILAILSVFR